MFITLEEYQARNPNVEYPSEIIQDKINTVELDVVQYLGATPGEIMEETVRGYAAYLVFEPEAILEVLDLKNNTQLNVNTIELERIGRVLSLGNSKYKVKYKVKDYYQMLKVIRDICFTLVNLELSDYLTSLEGKKYKSETIGDYRYDLAIDEPQKIKAQAYRKLNRYRSFIRAGVAR